VPLLAGLQTAPEDPKAKQAFLEKMEERRELVKRQRRENIRLIMKVAVAVVLVGVAVAAFVKSKPLRQWGISSSHPLGTLAKLEARLIGEYQMEKEPITKCADVNRVAAQIFRYSKPKCSRGEHVSAAGEITLFLDSKGRVEALLAAFPSPGPRGYMIINRSIGSIFLNELWRSQGGAKEKAFCPKETITASLKGSCGLSSMPSDGSFALLEKSHMRCIWAEFGPDTVSSTVYFEMK
jgi:hypothetical protein